MILGRAAKDKDVVYVCLIQFFEDLIHETLKSFGGFTKPKGHKGKFDKAERFGKCCIWMSSGWTGI